MAKISPWIVMSSSSGQTFQKLWAALSTEARAQHRMSFVDRDCAAEALMSQVTGKATAKGAKLECECVVLAWIAENNFKGPILLCGYFGLLSKEFLDRCGCPVINTHPSLLPAFPGLDKRVHALAYEQCTVSGFSVHLVNEHLDGGPVVFQHPVDIARAKNAEESRQWVRVAEQRWLAPVWEALLKSSVVAEHRHERSVKLREILGFYVESFGEPA